MIPDIARAAIKVAVNRSVPWVGAAILRVQLRMARDPRFRAQIEALHATLRP